MLDDRFRPALIELLEPRIAPALAVINPLFDLTVGPGKIGADIDLSRVFDPLITDNGHTIVTLNTNFDADPETDGIQPSEPIVIELLDDEAPLSVQNFLNYLNSSYVGTFFHRGVPGFVLQGGGFAAADPDTHIPTPFDLHNEFDPARSNVEGTIAMAKTGLGPHTATSEWFINVADNRHSIDPETGMDIGLDVQNGGFTVFARVLSGLDDVKAIIGLPKLTKNGSATETPVQNYDPDPDFNPATPSPEPTLEQLITITGFTVTPAPQGDPPVGVTYTFEVTDAATGLPTDLVTGSVTGTNLHLDYKAHAAGVVTVTVQGDDGQGSTASDTFTINLQPNLVASFEDDPFDGIIIGGDAKLSSLVIGNNGGGWAVGNVNVKVYLSKFTSFQAPVVLDPNVDLLVAEFLSQPLDLVGGGKTTIAKSLQIPQRLVTTAGEFYRVIVQVTPVDGAIDERFSDDNLGFDGKVHVWENRFGTFSISGFGERTNAKLFYKEADGDLVKLSITQKGSGQVNFDGTFADLVISKSKAGSVVNAKLDPNAIEGERDIDLHNIEFFKYLDTVNFSNVSLSGFLSASRGFHELHLGDVRGDGLLTIGNPPASISAKPAITLKSVTDFSIESLVRIKSLRALEWLESDGVANRISAPAIGTLAIVGRAGDIRGDLETSISLSGSESLGSMQVAGFLRHARLLAAGNVGEIRVGGLEDADIFIGVTSRPDDASDFAEVHSLGSLVVTGVGGAGGSLLDSNVAAARINSVFVTGIDDSGPKRFGIVADVLKSYNRGNVFTRGLAKEPQTFDKHGKYSVQIV